MQNENQFHCLNLGITYTFFSRELVFIRKIFEELYEMLCDRWPGFCCVIVVYVIAKHVKFICLPYFDDLFIIHEFMILHLICNK